MCEYKNGKIYKIVCEITGEVYIGSTRLSLEDRLSNHVAKSNSCCSKQIIDRNKYDIKLLEAYPCNNEHELRRKEGEYQRAFECINRRIECRTEAEYRLDNTKNISEYNKQYRLDNKEWRSEYNKQYSLENAEKIKTRNSKEVICECGTKSTYKHLPRHKRSKKHIDLMSKLKQPCAVLGDEGTLVC